MLKTFAEMLSYAFLQRAFIVGLLICLCASLLGTSLVLKRYSMMGDGLSHVGFGALAIATAFNLAPLYVAIPVCIAFAFLLLRMNESSKIKGDAAIAILSSGALAVGIMVVSLTTGMNVDVYNYMFGSILSISINDAWLSVWLSIAIIILFIFFYNKIFAVTFDETFAAATGVKSNVYNMILAVLTAVTIVLGMRMMGALLISSLMIFPSLTSMKICKKYKTVVFVSVIFSILCSIIGIYVSYVWSTPSGASVVIVNLIVFLFVFVYSEIKGRIFHVEGKNK